MKTRLIYAKQEVEVGVDTEGDEWVVRLLENSFRGHLLQWAPLEFTIQTTEGVVKGYFFRGKDFVDVHTPQGTFRLGLPSNTRRSTQAHAPGSLASPMPGKVLKVLVKPGQKVEAGETLMVLEAMKMEHKIQSPAAGKVEKIFFQEGERVAQDVDLLKIKS